MYNKIELTMPQTVKYRVKATKQIIVKLILYLTLFTNYCRL